MKAKALIGKGLKFLSKHDQTILTGVSIASGVMGVIFAWNARPKCEQVLNELNERGASKGEKAKALAHVFPFQGLAATESRLADTFPSGREVLIVELHGLWLPGERYAGIHLAHGV